MNFGSPRLSTRPSLAFGLVVLPAPLGDGFALTRPSAIRGRRVTGTTHRESF